MTKKEVASMKRRAERGDAYAMMGMGCNRYCAEEYAEAVAWYENAADKGNVQAMINLGYCYYYGRLGKVDYATAYKWYSKALACCADDEENYPEALFKLGDHYRYGYFVEKDPNVAFLYYERAYRAATMHGEVEDQKGEEWTGLLTADTAFRMGECYRDGIGVKRNIGLALSHFIEAERGFKCKVAFGDKFAHGLLAKARKAVDETMKEFREEKSRV